LQFVGAFYKAQGIEVKGVELLRGLDVMQDYARRDGRARMSRKPKAFEGFDS